MLTANTADAANLVINWGFSDGLDGWESTGTVEPASGLAIVSDDGATESLLYQVVATDPGMHDLRFDFWNLTSDKVPEETLPDFAVASLFLLEDPSAFDPEAGTGFVESIDLLEAEFDRESVLADGGAVDDAPLDDRFSSFSVSFDNPLGLAVAIVFRLIDLNFEDNDSRLFLDNVVMKRPEAVIDARWEAGVLVVDSGAGLEVSTTLEDGGWVGVERADFAVAIVPARNDGRATQVRVVGDESETAEFVESALLPGFRRIDFKGGALEVSGAGLDEWTGLPDSPGPVIIADPGARKLFFRSVVR